MALFVRSTKEWCIENVEAEAACLSGGAGGGKASRRLVRSVRGVLGKVWICLQAWFVSPAAGRTAGAGPGPGSPAGAAAAAASPQCGPAGTSPCTAGTLATCAAAQLQIGALSPPSVGVNTDITIPPSAAAFFSAVQGATGGGGCGAGLEKRGRGGQ
eukprot:Rhum_TRINITY_DN8806_c0_g1::Rhum_TRINITY_DN8806_c0_g1_i1::g.29993::m.29993